MDVVTAMHTRNVAQAQPVQGLKAIKEHLGIDKALI